MVFKHACPCLPGMTGDERAPFLPFIHARTHKSSNHEREARRTGDGGERRSGVGEAAEDVRHEHRVEGVARRAVCLVLFRLGVLCGVVCVCVCAVGRDGNGETDISSSSSSSKRAITTPKQTQRLAYRPPNSVGSASTSPTAKDTRLGSTPGGRRAVSGWYASPSALMV